MDLRFLELLGRHLFAIWFFLALKGFAPSWVAVAGSADVSELIQELIRRFGHVAVFAAAFIEATPVGFYFPGLAIIVVAGLVTGRSSFCLPLVISSTGAGFVLAYVFNFSCGRLGWARLFRHLGLQRPLRRMTRRLQDATSLTLFMLLLHPNVGAVASTAAGVLRRPFGSTSLSFLVASILSATFWCGSAFLIGPCALQFISARAAIILLAAALVVAIMKKRARGKPRAMGSDGEVDAAPSSRSSDISRATTA